jgi:hypothetical protein
MVQVIVVLLSELNRRMDAIGVVRCKTYVPLEKTFVVKVISRKLFLLDSFLYYVDGGRHHLLIRRHGGTHGRL